MLTICVCIRKILCVHVTVIFFLSRSNLTSRLRTLQCLALWRANYTSGLIH